MSEWKGQSYKVYYYVAEFPLTLEAWLEKKLTEENLFLISANDNYYIFKVLDTEASK